jgi:hypothetical protein
VLFLIVPYCKYETFQIYRNAIEKFVKSRPREVRFTIVLHSPALSTGILFDHEGVLFTAKYNLLNSANRYAPILSLVVGSLFSFSLRPR